MTSKYQEYLLLERRFSDSTVIAYLKDINQYLFFIEFRLGLLQPIEAKKSHIRSWVASLVDEGLDHKSVNRKLSAIRGFYKFLEEAKMVEINPVIGVPSLKEKKRLVRALTNDEIDALLNENSFAPNKIGRRDRFILFTLYAFGLRRSELLNLRIDSVDINNQTIRVLGKRKKERELPCLPDWIKLFQLHCSEWSELKSNDKIFTNEKGNSLNPRALYSIVNSYLKKASSIDTKGPHVLRHSFATHLLDMGADLSSIRELLGHANLSATQIYTHASIKHLKQVYLKSHPGRR
jgi:integrase/recombinase XerC